MMPDTSTFYGQQGLVPPQFLLQGLFGHLQGQHGPSFGGFPQQGLLNQLPAQYGHQPIWPSFGFAPQNPFAILSSLYGQHPIWPSFGGGFGPFTPISPYQQLGQHGGAFQGGWPHQQLGGFPPQFGAPIGGFLPQLAALGQQYPMNAFGRGIGVPQMAYLGC
jgi:hypothetical protein